MANEPDHPSLVTRLRIEAHAVWLAARDPGTPWHVRLIALLVAAYALSPIDLVPEGKGGGATPGQQAGMLIVLAIWIGLALMVWTYL